MLGRAGSLLVALLVGAASVGVVPSPASAQRSSGAAALPSGGVSAGGTSAADAIRAFRAQFDGEAAPPSLTFPDVTVPSGSQQQVQSVGDVGDPVGDAVFAPGDITRASLDAGTDALVGAVTVAKFEDPSSQNWDDDTGIVWFLDEDHNGVADDALVLVGIDGELVGGLLGAHGDCGDGLTHSDASAAFYGVAVPASCLAGVPRFGWYAEMLYTDVASATTATDDAPDDVWAMPEVANNAGGQLPPVPPVSACPQRSLPHPQPFAEYDSFVPERLLDTRPVWFGNMTFDCLQMAIGRLAAGSTTTVPIGGRAGIPDDADAAEGNVTVTDAGGPGFVTLFPCGQPRPMASNLNYVTGDTAANSGVVALGTGGTLCVFTSAATDLVIDVSGYFVAGSSLVSSAPVRLLDSRPANPTIDGQAAGIGVRAGGTITTLQVVGRAGVPTGTGAVMLNVTAVDAVAPGYVTVFPCGQPRPNSSNLNYTRGRTVAAAVLAKLAPDGSVCLFTLGATHLVVDVQGWFDADSSVVPLVPARLGDTRPGYDTIDHLGGGGTPVGPAVRWLVPIAGRGGVPADATAAVLNVTAVDAPGPGYLTIAPCDRPMQGTSNVNYGVGSIVANQVIAVLGADGSVCVFSSGISHVVVDVDGYIE
ncbi:MAG: hypothetical protein QM733_21995 [Ilumatobacteraceae bacterium]